jgi:hypothetical protein
LNNTRALGFDETFVPSPSASSPGVKAVPAIPREAENGLK